jgi:hypothetical protein
VKKLILLTKIKIRPLVFNDLQKQMLPIFNFSQLLTHYAVREINIALVRCRM